MHPKWKVVALALPAAFLVACKDQPTAPPAALQQNHAIAALRASAQAATVQRPLSDFLTAQSLPTGWVNSDNPLWFYAVDYAGYYAQQLGIGTTFDGTVTERPLSDGTAEVTVDIRSANALTWMRTWPAYDLVFGENPAAVSGGAAPTLGYVHLIWDFINPASGAPIQDLATSTVLTKKIQIEANAFGPLTAASGLGPDGTPGHGWVNQVGMLTKFHGENAIDGFTAELVKLQAVGR
jgi:hypothetical protein